MSTVKQNPLGKPNKAGNNEGQIPSNKNRDLPSKQQLKQSSFYESPDDKNNKNRPKSPKKNQARFPSVFTRDQQHLRPHPVNRTKHPSNRLLWFNVIILSRLLFSKDSLFGRRSQEYRTRNPFRPRVWMELEGRETCLVIRIMFKLCFRYMSWRIKDYMC